jgi:6-phosphogluconolactonase (cycloisomerase 2 family)
MTCFRSIFWMGLTILAFVGVVQPTLAQSVTATYLGTIGTPDATGSDNGHFANPASVAFDRTNGHLLVVDQLNERVQIFDAATFGYVATLGTTGLLGTDNAHFYLPQGVAFDSAHDRILVADSGNERVQIYDAATLAYVATIGTTGTLGSNNSEFDLPASVAYEPAHNQILVADQNNDRVQVFDGSSFGYVATIGQTGQSLLGPGVFSLPSGIGIDTVNNHIWVADLNTNQVQILDTGSFSFVGVIGDSQANSGSGNTQFNAPAGVSFDTTNSHILVADFGNARVQIFDAASFAYLGTIGQTDAPGTGNGSLNGPASVAVYPASTDIFIADTDNQRIQVYSQAAASSPLVAAVLPGSRSVEIGTTATVFGVMLNSGSSSLGGCQISLPASASAGLSLGYQTTNTSNALTGAPNTPASIAPNGAQNFLLSFKSTAAVSVTSQPLVFGCSGVEPAASTPGVNTVDLLFSNTPIADIIALAATASGDGIVTIPFSSTNAAAFAVASVDVGTSGTLTAEVDTGSATLPLSVTACATNPSTGACLGTPSASFQQSYQPNSSQTYSVFLSAGGKIPFAPATSRVFLRFLDSSGASHGSTSVAVQAD